MFKRLSLLIVTAICVSAGSAHCLEAVKVAVLPFEIQGSDAFNYLESEIPELIKKHLRQEGGDIVETAVEEAGVRDADSLRKIGLEGGADYVVWGTLSWVGDTFRLDATLIATPAESVPEEFSQEGEGVENLLGAVTGVARDLSVKMFERVKIVEVNIVGNQRVEADAIKRVMASTPGEIYLSRRIPEDIKAIHAMGYFDDIRAVVNDVPGGKSIVLTVKEKQRIRLVLVRGNKAMENDKIAESIDIRPGSVLNVFRIQADIDGIRELYKEKNYHNVEVKHSVRSLKNNQADLIFVIKEGEKLLVKQILFDGNASYTDDELKAVMKTSEKGFFSWITASGDMNIDDLNEDIQRLRDHYHTTGYIAATVDEPQIEYVGNWISIAIRIDEGSRFRVGKVDITGDLLSTKAEMMAVVKSVEEKYYNSETMRHDVVALTDLYADAGYAFAEVIPKTDEVAGDGVVDITYAANKGKMVYFERINIAGNTKTRDKVIRRELIIDEQGLYSGKDMKTSIRNLYRLDFFQDISVDTSKGSADDRVVVDLAVRERSTSAFSFGGMYSEYEGTFIRGYFEERNFLGRGSSLLVGVSLGGISDTYLLSYTEPWSFDIPLAAGFDVYKQDVDYNTYELSQSGFGLRFSYRIRDLTRVYLSYNLTTSEIKNFSFFIPDSVRFMDTSNTASIISTAFRYDGRNRQLEPTEGAYYGVTFHYAGLGGDIAFAKTILESGWFVPIYRRLIGFIHSKGGYIQEVSGEEIPDYERFYLGGVDSLRGFDYLSISPVKTNAWGFRTRSGGDKYVQFNFELQYPLADKAGVLGFLFYDTGNVFDTGESIDLGNLRHSAGFGLRWFSPMGPMRFENGFILDPEPGESSGGSWSFTIGGAF